MRPNTKLLKKTSDGTVSFFKKTYFSDVKLKDGWKSSSFFTNTKDALTNSKNPKNFIDSENGADVKGFFIEILAPNYETLVVTPSQENVLKQLGVFRNTAFVEIKIGTTVVLDTALSQILPPMPIFLKGEGADSTKPFQVMNAEHNPISGVAKMAVLQFGKDPKYFANDTQFSFKIYLKNEVALNATLSEYIVSVSVMVDEYIEKIAVARAV